MSESVVIGAVQKTGAFMFFFAPQLQCNDNEGSSFLKH